MIARCDALCSSFNNVIDMNQIVVVIANEFGCVGVSEVANGIAVLVWYSWRSCGWGDSVVLNHERMIDTCHLNFVVCSVGSH